MKWKYIIVRLGPRNRKNSMSNQLKLINAINKSVFNAVMTSIIDSGYRPHIVAVTEYIDGLPQEYYKEKTITLNIHPEAIGSWSEDELSVHIQMRFNQIPRKVTVPYAAVIAMLVKDGRELIQHYNLNTHELRDTEIIKQLQEQLTGKVFEPVPEPVAAESASNVIQFKPRAK